MDRIALKQKIILIVLGFLLFIFLVEISLRVGKYIFFSSQEYQNKIALSQKDAYRILCLGDSTTAFGAKQSWPNQLQEILNAKIKNNP